MTIKGEKYQLAGFEIYQKGTLVDVFAKFCGVEEDPLNLPKTHIHPFFKEEMPVMYPTIGVDAIVEALVGQRDLKKGRERFDLMSSGLVINDLGPEKLAQLLIEIGKAKKEYMKEGAHTFLPVGLSAQKPE